MKKGFSLVELLVVLVVIGIILAVILPNTLRAIEQANVRDTAATLRGLDTAAALCYSQTRDWDLCNSVDELTTTEGGVTPYMDAVPANSPFGNAYDKWTGDKKAGFKTDKSVHFTGWPNLNKHK